MISKKIQSDPREFSTGGTTGSAIPNQVRTGSESESERHPAGIFLEFLRYPKNHGQQKNRALSRLGFLRVNH